MTKYTIVPKSSNQYRVIAGGGQGPPGPPGPPGAGDGGIHIPFGYGDASPHALLTLNNQTVISATIVITQAFDGVGATLRLGDATTPGRLIDIAQNLPSAIGAYQTYPCYLYQTSTPILLTIVPGAGATQGAGFILLEV